MWKFLLVGLCRDTCDAWAASLRYGGESQINQGEAPMSTATMPTTDNKVKFISLTVNGSTHYLNKTVYARSCPSGWGGVTTHIQLNGDSKQTDYSLWADKWVVKLW